MPVIFGVSVGKSSLLEALVIHRHGDDFALANAQHVYDGPAEGTFFTAEMWPISYWAARRLDLSVAAH